MRKIYLLLLALLVTPFIYAQSSKGITMEEYTLAKTFDIKNPDEDSYEKFGGNKYIAERYEERKPYFITGDDGMKKRIDLYTLSRKGESLPIGTMIYYTTETGKRYIACIPNTFSEGKVWEQYFSDIHGIDKVEKFFVLKLSYVLSKEFSYQQYKATLKGDASNRSEAGTYGNDICFPGDDLVAMADGSKHMMKDIKVGDKVLTVDPKTHNPKVSIISKTFIHKAENYAMSTLTLLQATPEKDSHSIHLSVKEISATPNHPMATEEGTKNIGSIAIGERILCLDPITKKMAQFTVWDKSESAGGYQQVYNMETAEGSTFIMNGVMVRQK